ncbi:TlpA family protein disulfide reductase [Pedobacter heparinus]|uniref:Redoxin domain protein n=1 Tax=Pedobacter heparinus (strain ATCC 13125 / DSM 2366 / CIP 104194 / JCM 7457 / NBRC 12017 / NCIMB 9290 / NRRL B-14731 / HIM 762-3) TaxID=485917 RepID=C6Y2W0_PEDHD|nr:TlpA family protein disulfide reductase [Pedobacter heparinus]ACU03173.1 Redoxin domain protein [Pedobacter heparinus DSM 2366]
MKNQSLHIFLIAVAILLTNIHVNAQRNEAFDLTARGIIVGQDVPHIEISNLHNYFDKDRKQRSTVNISSFRGKLVILDFWATWCSPCIGMMPVMDSLQRRFEGKVQFLSITAQPDTIVVPFLKKLFRGKKMDIPFATSDVLVSKVFPHRLLPHYVWIDETGKVLAITSHEEVNAKEIESVINKQPTVMRQKKDMAVKYDRNKPLFLAENGGSGKGLIYHSMLTEWGEGLSMGSWINPAMGKATVANLGIKEMYAAAFSEKLIIGQHRVINQMKDPGTIHYDGPRAEADSWMKKNMFCYELVLPEGKRETLRSHMIGDLKKLFPKIWADTAHVETMCTVLVSTGDNSAMRSKGDKRAIEVNSLGISVTNMGIVALTSRLDIVYLQENPYPIVDNSGIKFPVDFKLDCDLGSVTSINKALSQYNLKLVNQRFTTNMLIFKDAQAKVVTHNQ